MGTETDTIPRASIEHLFASLQLLRRNAGRSTFDALRLHLLAGSKRRAPNSRTAMWTVARDVLGELSKLGFVVVGTLPRKLADVDRLRATPCEITAMGSELADLHAQNEGQAYDRLLLLWFKEHSHFRSFLLRVLQSPLFVPDITNLSQLGLEESKGRAISAFSASLAMNCSRRLERVGWSPDKLTALRAGIAKRAEELHSTWHTADLDAKRLIDLVQDSIVLPTFLDVEKLPFDPVTFQQLLRSAQEFLCAGWTASYPQFEGRVVYATCEFDPDLGSPGTLPTKVIHHGLTYAELRFADAIKDGYEQVAGTTSAYVSAYQVRAVVCIQLHLPMAVFARCLEKLVAGGPKSGIAIYTELPFGPPPQGESYLEIGKRRIGRLKINQAKGDQRGA